MKRFRTILTAAALCMIFVMAAGCSISQATNIELISYPKTEFLVDEDISELPFTILVTLNNGKTTQISFTPENPGAVQVANFSTAAPGSFTAYFTYRSFTYRFDYTVSTGEYTGFAGGSGIATDPYQIANAEQFKNIVLRGNTVSEGKENGYVYYELIADIDLSGLDVAADSAYLEKIELGNFKYPTESEYSFNGSLNGNGHKLMNFKATTDLGIFGTILKGNFSNIVIDGFNTVGYRVGAFGTGLYDQENGASATFDRVTINANCQLGFGGYIFQAKGAKSVTFTDCIMNGNVYGDGDNVGGFLGDAQCKVTFTNCQMNGDVVGFSQVGAFAGWVSNSDTEGVLPDNITGTWSYTDLLTFTEVDGVQTNTLGDTASITYNSLCGNQYYPTETGSKNNDTLITPNYPYTGNNLSTDQTTHNAKFKQLTSIDVTNGGITLTWDPVAVEGETVAYYRVVFGGTFLHFTKNNNAYDLHFVGGYVTPLEVSDQITGKTSYGGTENEKVYTAFATTGIDGLTINWSDKINTQYSVPVKTSDGVYTNLFTGEGLASVPTDATWLDVKADIGNSLVIAYDDKVTIRVFAYNADGIIIAGGQVA